VILDADLAVLYGVPTKVLVQAVKRNAARFFEVTSCDLKELSPSERERRDGGFAGIDPI
jgi:hypothetical protein